MYAGLPASFTVQGIPEPYRGIIENGTWGPTAGRTMKGILETMKNITIVEPMVTIRSTMKESDLPAMEALADVIANA